MFYKFFKFTFTSICLLACLSLAINSPAGNISGFPLEFSTFRLGEDNRAVLIVGGIQGDEPGGFSAATLLATRYEIYKGALWVVPNLNFPSIIKRSRGIHGDMNRKFARLDEQDPEFTTVRKIQQLIDHPDTQLVLNLHDGSGYYRPRYEDRLKNPHRWGQSIIIDQEQADDVFMGDLIGEAQSVADKVNQSLLKPLHAIHVRNTNTAAGDTEMEKSLSYYAVRHNKAAFGIEASKEISVAARVYYHLSIVEAFLKLAGIEFQRDFVLTVNGVERALGNNLGVSFAGNRVFLPLDNIRPSIKYLPLPHVCIASAITSWPIMAVVPCENNAENICIHFGNRKLTLINPDWHEAEENLDAMRVLVDGQEKLAPFGQVVTVKNTVLVKKENGYRVNVIGFDKGLRDESEVNIRHDDINRKFSLDRDGTLFRVEVYKGKRFAGMFLLRFSKKPVNKARVSAGND